MSEEVPRAPTLTELDYAFRAALGQASGGLSPTAFMTAWFDWAVQLAASPGRQMELAQDALHRSLDAWTFAARAATGAPVLPAEGMDNSDPSYQGEAWSRYPFNVIARNYQHGAAFLNSLPKDIVGLAPRAADLVGFTVHQWLAALSPANFPATNPELLELTRAEGGENLKRGAAHLLEDLNRAVRGGPTAKPSDLKVGRDLAITPGQVVYRNALIELIQYAPSTSTVYAEPVLITPAWIMKYYILDLSPRNSLVKYLVDQGHTVFMISWKNPEAGDRDFAMDDYVRDGFLAALDAVATIVPKVPVHAVGYCIGGTLLAVAAAVLAREGDDRLGSVTLFAAQTDFSEPGELSLFISKSQLALLEAQMRRDGVLDSRQMGAAFAMLRPRDLIWQPMVTAYLKGERPPVIDLMAWNADGTRMPYKMHTEYLYRLYLDNELSTGRFPYAGRPVTLADIRVPMFVVGTETDHVAPWKSVYKIENLARSRDYTFLLTSGGHNAGIVSGPVHPKRQHRIRSWRPGERHVAPEEWMEGAAPEPGSWWPTWQGWLAAHSSGLVAPPATGAPDHGLPPIEDAPGQYVRAS
jgi:polyhydroxyalkanoate synthase subunit PhaC